jgi:hypothetical protein
MISVRNKIISVSTAMALLFMTSGLPEALAKRGDTTISVIPTITSVSLVNGVLVATGTATATIHGETTTVPFSAPVDITLAQNQPPGAICPVLDLMLGPINLNLLGLVVQTSPICLTITAEQGGGLLGDLLCSLGQALAGGATLNQALEASPDLNALLAGITDLLNQALGQLYNATLISITQVAQRRTCAILHLELGPLDLTLLGLNVVLDNCANGPITVDITAVTGRGNLLGNLLCQLLGGGLINLGATLQQILNQIIALLTG